jgi:DMSO/TMAO reductase YedYZ molybdopterin-dependent catalytic subunit
MLTRRIWLSTTTSAAVASALPKSSRANDELLKFGGRPQNLATPISFFDRLITPNSVFFVRSHFGPPALDPSRKLVIDGLVEKPLSLSLSELRSFPEVTLVAVLQCAGNGRALQVPRVPGIQWVHGAMGQAAWTGVRLRDLLAKVVLRSEAAHVRLASADLPPKPQVPAFIRSIPLARALAADTLIAYRMNGEPLSLSHGAPLRMVVPGWAGDHWVKWLTGLHVQADEADGFFMRTAYRVPKGDVLAGASVPPAEMRPATTFPVKSLIATPEDGSTARIGLQEVAGIAFSGEGAIEKVEISFDDGGTWQAAKIEGTSGVGRWQVFRLRVPRQTPGPMSAIARAVERGGRKQPEHAAWNPSGYFWNGWHRVTWRVSA